MVSKAGCGRYGTVVLRPLSRGMPDFRYPKMPHDADAGIARMQVSGRAKTCIYKHS